MKPSWLKALRSTTCRFPGTFFAFTKMRHTTSITSMSKLGKLRLRITYPLGLTPLQLHAHLPAVLLLLPELSRPAELHLRLLLRGS